MITQNRARAGRKAAAPRATARETPPSRFTCSRCGFDDVRKSGPADILASLAHESGFRIYRCRACHASYFEQV